MLVLLGCVLPRILAGCAPEALDEADAPDLLAQASIDGGVRITPSVDAGRRDAGQAAPGVGGASDAGSDAPAGETVTLPDGGVIYLDQSCPDRDTLFGTSAVGCCRNQKCGLSNHELDFPGVSLECQTYDQVKELDSEFDLEPRACRMGPSP